MPIEAIYLLSSIILLIVLHSLLVGYPNLGNRAIFLLVSSMQDSDDHVLWYLPMFTWKNDLVMDLTKEGIVE